MMKNMQNRILVSGEEGLSKSGFSSLQDNFIYIAEDSLGHVSEFFIDRGRNPISPLFEKIQTQSGESVVKSVDAGEIEARVKRDGLRIIGHVER